MSNPSSKSDPAFLSMAERLVDRVAGYGRTLSNDPRWMKAKYPGVDGLGRSFARGDDVLYWPSTKTFMTGAEAKAAWHKFLSEKGDEEGMPYARSASPERVAEKFAEIEAFPSPKNPWVKAAIDEISRKISPSLSEAAKIMKKGEAKKSLGHLHYAMNALGSIIDDLEKMG